MKPEYEIFIQGQRYLVRADEPREHLIEVARYVDGRLAETTGGRQAASYPHAVLACLNIASELFRLREEADSLRRLVSSRAQEVVDKVDATLRELDGEEE